MNQTDAYLYLCCAGELSAGQLRKKLLERSAVELLDELSLKQKAQDELPELKQKMEAQKVFFCASDDERYPIALKKLSDAPSGLFYCGRMGLELFHKPAVAIVGTRRATSYGKNFAQELARELARRDITVLSGLALGIDACAHEGALAVAGPTAAVLGCGPDIVYPNENKELFEKIRQQGIILSEFPVGRKPDRSTFPRRNRIVSCLACALVVVESELTGGAMITANHALSQGRPLFALPGRIDVPTSEGPNALLEKGARAIASIDGFLSQLSQLQAGKQSDLFCKDNPQEQLSKQKPIKKKNTNPQLECFVQGEALTAEEYAQRNNLPFSKASADLMLFEIEGMLQKRSDGRYELREPSIIFNA